MIWRALFPRGRIQGLDPRGVVLRACSREHDAQKAERAMSTRRRWVLHAEKGHAQTPDTAASCVGCSGGRQNRSTHSTVPQKETWGLLPSWSSRLITRSRSTHLEPERGRECRHDHLFAAVLDRQHSRRARPSIRSWRWSLPGCATRSAAACTPKRLCSTRRCAQPVPPGPASVWPVACAGDTACAARTGQCMNQAMPFDCRQHLWPATPFLSSACAVAGPQRVEYFKGSKLVDTLIGPKYKGKMAKDMPIKTRAEAAKLAQELLRVGYIHRSKRMELAHTRRWELELQHGPFEDSKDALFTWVYEGAQPWAPLLPPLPPLLLLLLRLLLPPLLPAQRKSCAAARAQARRRSCT